MLGNGGAEPAGFGNVVAFGEVAAFTGGRGDQRVVGVGLFPGVAANDVVLDAIAMAIDTGHPGLEMDVLFGGPFFVVAMTFLIGEEGVTMTVVAAFVG